MLRWRIGVGLALVALIVIPLLLPVLASAGHLSEFREDGKRLLALAANTGFLVLGVLALALPTGVGAAVLLYRTDLPGRAVLRCLVFLSLFVPLPLIVSVWEAAVGAAGWLHVVVPSLPEQVWLQGLLAAICIHALAGIPWVILMVGMGLTWVEAELEEDGLLITNAGKVLLCITLPRCRALIGAAALWIALFTAAEVTVTDRMRVRTFAEEIRLQMNLGGGAGEAGAILVALPTIIATFVLVCWLAPRLERALPPLSLQFTPRPLFRLGRWRTSALVLTLLVVGCAAWPLAGLVWKLGLQGYPATWSPSVAAERWSVYQRLYGLTLAANFLVAVSAGLLTAMLALLSCWAAERSRPLRVLLLTTTVLAWVLPGPLVGLGLKQWILTIAAWPPLAFLHHGPSHVPVVWAYVIRFFPYAVACLWLIVRLVPTELRDAGRLDGLDSWGELRCIIWPLTWSACGWTALLVAALALGEVAASVSVRSPGTETFALLVLDRLHYGAESDVAALCLIFLALLVTVVIVVCGYGAGLRRWYARKANDIT